MSATLHITSGDCARDLLRQSGLPGEVFVWRDILYDGPRTPGWPDVETLRARAAFLVASTGGALDAARVLETLQQQYEQLAAASDRDRIVLWFDACLFDQAMLVHILACLQLRGAQNVELLCVDAFPGIVSFHGLGQLNPQQLAALHDQRRPVTADQYAFATRADRAFATQDIAALKALAHETATPLASVPAAAARWIAEQPDPVTGLGRLAGLALDAIRAGNVSPGAIFAATAAADTPPQFWGDTTLWAIINALADHEPPLIDIQGPAPRLPQWESPVELDSYRITARGRGACD